MNYLFYLYGVVVGITIGILIANAFKTFRK